MGTKLTRQEIEKIKQKQQALKMQKAKERQLKKGKEITK